MGLLIILAGCGAAPAGSGSPASGPAGSAGPGGSVPEGSAVPGASMSGGTFANPIPDDFGFGSGDVDLPDPTVGLAELASYRATLVETFAGTVDGQAKTWSVTRSLALTRNPIASELRVEATGAAAPEAARSRWVVGDVEYATTDGGSCGGSPGTGPVEAEQELATQLSAVIGAVAAGSDVVNGVEANRSTFEEAALGLGATADVEGALWVAAASGGYVVRWALTATGDGEFFGSGVSGTWTSTYDLTDANAVAAIDVPADCPPGVVDAPAIDGATNVVGAPGVLTYEAPSNLTDVVAFYQGRASGLGWTESHEAQITETVIVLEYDAAAGSVTVFASATSSGVRVSVVVDR